MEQYIGIVLTLILLFAFVLITLVRNIPKQKRVIIEISTVGEEVTSLVSFSGYTEEEKIEVLNLVRFEVMGVTRKIEDYEES